ncbi:hypothetical protein [Acinetobacter sp. AG3]|uniref:hypothetical protein n=1 Tax=Acinetobacter sp. AG3 TaxID=2912245 RepID=UPI001EEFF3E4|nr:hypothetical protein [Acinetobacter sp. AG3]MCG7221397.1 hypothetical protein [Acinetobacter sp. AG3]
MGNEIAADNKITNITAKKNTREILGWVLHNVVWIWLIALVIIFGAFNEYFLTVFNLQNIMVQATVLGLLGLAVALPLLIAEIDLSIPANAGFPLLWVHLLILIGDYLGLPRFYWAYWSVLLLGSLMVGVSPN